MSVKSNSADVFVFHLKPETQPGPETLCCFFEYETDKVQKPGKPKKEEGRQNAR